MIRRAGLGSCPAFSDVSSRDFWGYEEATCAEGRAKKEQRWWELGINLVGDCCGGLSGDGTKLGIDISEEWRGKDKVKKARNE